MTTNNRPDFQSSLDTQRLYEALNQHEPGQEITYSSLSKILGRSVERDARNNLTTARNQHLRTTGKVFASIHKVGLRCLTDEEKANLAPQTLKGIRRKSRKTAKKMLTVEKFTDLSPQAQVAHNTGLTILGFISQAAKANTVKKLSGRVAALGKKLPYVPTLDELKALAKGITRT